jgi:uncharacterized protein (DUF2237 family)
MGRLPHTAYCAYWEILADSFSEDLTRRDSPPPWRMASNVLGTPLQACCRDPLTGFYRDGFCHTGPEDRGLHTVCVVITEEFLAFTRSVGNDLSTPVPAYGFPGLEPGDRWCLCVTRWAEALQADCAPAVVLAATHVSALEFVSREDLQAHAVA